MPPAEDHEAIARRVVGPAAPGGHHCAARIVVRRCRANVGHRRRRQLLPRIGRHLRDHRVDRARHEAAPSADTGARRAPDNRARSRPDSRARLHPGGPRRALGRGPAARARGGRLEISTAAMEEAHGEGSCRDDRESRAGAHRPTLSRASPARAYEACAQARLAAISRRLRASRRSAHRGKGRHRRSRGCPARRPAYTSCCTASPCSRSCTPWRDSTRQGRSPRRTCKSPGSWRARPRAPAADRRPTSTGPARRCQAPDARPRASSGHTP